MSDHFGVVAYVDVGSFFASKAKQAVSVARDRRSQLVGLRDQSQQKERVEVRAKSKADREELALARQRASERDRDDYRRAQQRGARQRHTRRATMRKEAFGDGALFADAVVSHPAVSAVVPCAPSEVNIPALNDIPRGS